MGFRATPGSSVTRVLGVVATLGVLSTGVAFAGPYEDAQNNLVRASRDYFRALQKERDTSPAVREKLRLKYIVPAEKQASEAYAQEEREVLAAASRGSKGQDKASPKTKASGAPSPEPSSEPAVVIDGKDIPREIEFSGAKPSPKPNKR